MSLLVASNNPPKEPVPQFTATLMDTNGSVRPKGSFYMRIPYKSLDHVLSQMQNQVQKFKGNQQVRAKAVGITQSIRKDNRTGLPDRRNFDAIAQAVYQWMKTNIQYIRDPHGIELLQSPLKTLEYGYGDCDDQSILAASLLSSLGVPTRFKVVKANPSNPNGFSHVYVQYFASGSWKGFDPTLHTQAGDELADSRIFGKKYVDLSDSDTLIIKKKCPCKGTPMSSLVRKSRSSMVAQAPVYNINSGQKINDELGFLPALPVVAGAVTKGGVVFSGAKSIFNSVFGKKDGRSDAGKERDVLRDYLSKKGFTWKKSIYNNGKDDFNIGAYNKTQLQNLIVLNEEYPSLSVQDHNSKKIHKDTLNTTERWNQTWAPIKYPSNAVVNSGNSTTTASNRPAAAGFSLNVQDPKVLIGGGLLVAGMAYTAYSLKSKAAKAKK